MTELPARPPEVTPETAPFWEATAEGRLVLPRCDECGLVVWYPRSICPDCGSGSLTWTELSGRGTVYSRTIQRRAHGRWAEHAPYVIAYVELEEGPRVLADVDADDPESVRIGDPVEAVFDPTGDDPGAPALLRFRPR